MNRILVGSATLLISAAAHADDRHSITMSAIVGPQLYEHEYSPSKTETIADTFTANEQIGVQYQWTKLVQPSLAVQTVHSDASTENPSRFTGWQLQPGIAVSIGDPFSLGIDAVLAPRSSGKNEFAWGVQPRAGCNLKMRGRLSFVGQVQVPVMLHPSRSVSVTPFVGLGYELFE